MPFFRRKKEDEEEEYEEEETPKKKLRKGEFRDLISQNIKKRREPPKPWGKPERLLVLIVFLLTIITSGVLALSARNWKLPGLPRVKLPSFNLLKEETIVIEKDKDQAGAKERAKTAIGKFKEKTKNLSGIYGLYVLELASGFSYGVYEDEQFEPASLNKLPVMIGMYMEEEKGNLSLSSQYKLKNEDKIGGSGSLYGKPAGTVLTYRDLVRYMGQESDNTAFNIAKNILGEEKIREVIKDIGMNKTVILGENQTTTPSDIGLLFKKLWDEELVSEKSRDEILGYLTNTTYENWLAAGVPKEVRVAHKFGRELHIVNDAGVVFTKKLSEPGGSLSRRPYVVVVLSKGIVEKEADEILPILSKIIFQEENI